MYGSSPNINEKTSHSNFSSASQIRLSHLKPPTHEPKGPLFLQQISVSLNIPKHDNELPDYNLSPIALSDDQHTIRSLNMITSSNDQPSNQSSASKASMLVRQNTTGFMHRNSDKPTLASNKERQSIVGNIDIFAQQARERRAKRYLKIEKFLDSKYVNIYLVIITIYALFGVDFGNLVTSKQVDTVFDVITLICTVSFFIEMALSYISKQDYRLSFFFWLDVISTLSMLLDLSFIPSEAVGAQADATQIARAGRVSKIGARAGRVLRVIRVLKFAKIYNQVKESDKLIRSNSQSIQSLTNLVDNIVKLKKQLAGSAKPSMSHTELERAKSLIKEKDSKENNLLDPQNLFEDKNSFAHAPRRLSQFATIGRGMKTMGGPGTSKRLEPKNMLVASLTEVNAKQIMNQDKTVTENPNIPKESRVGKTLSELTTKRVIIIVMIILLIIPLMTSDPWSSNGTSYSYDAAELTHAHNTHSFSPQETDIYINDMISRHKSTITPLIYFRAPNGTVVYETDPPYTDIRQGHIDTIEYDDTPDLLIVVNISISAKVSAATNIGKTLFICLILGVGSLLFSKDANDLVLRPLERMVEKVNRIAVSPLSVKRESLMDETGKRNEVAVLENAITKIGTLLALGFGDAGAEIIAQNMTQSGDMDPMVCGEKIMAVFGFCDIRNFTDATEVLQQDVMAFVNSIAELVHDKIDKYGGAANKNIGDAFLLVWKFPRSEVEEMDEELQLKNTDLVKGMADLSLFSFLKIYAKINQSHVLRKYRNNQKLLERLPGFRVKMGFGLHVGWAIEGAIGSEFKIDASYLSPNVNIASRLEAATKQYGVPLLVSNDLYVLFSEEVQRYCRKIDVVTVKGSQVPLALYTVDIDSNELRDKGASKRSKKERIRRHEMKKQKLLELIWEGKLSTHLLFEKDKDLKIAMKKGFQVEPKKIWEDAFEAYIEGDWMKARLMLDRYLVMKEGDGPATTLLRYMSSLDYRKPHDWRGFRELTEK